MISITTLVTGSQHLPELMTTAMQPPASLRITTILVEAPLARARMFGCKAGAAPIQNVEKEREALLLFHLSPATRTNATLVS